jgi:hypothetical protein
MAALGNGDTGDYDARRATVDFAGNIVEAFVGYCAFLRGT